MKLRHKNGLFLYGISMEISTSLVIRLANGVSCTKAINSAIFSHIHYELVMLALM